MVVCRHVGRLIPQRETVDRVTLSLRAPLQFHFPGDDQVFLLYRKATQTGSKLFPGTIQVGVLRKQIKILIDGLNELLRAGGTRQRYLLPEKRSSRAEGACLTMGIRTPVFSWLPNVPGPLRERRPCPRRCLPPVEFVEPLLDLLMQFLE